MLLKNVFKNTTVTLMIHRDNNPPKSPSLYFCGLFVKLLKFCWISISLKVFAFDSRYWVTDSFPVYSVYLKVNKELLKIFLTQPSVLLSFLPCFLTSTNWHTSLICKKFLETNIESASRNGACVDWFFYDCGVIIKWKSRKEILIHLIKYLHLIKF